MAITARIPPSRARTQHHKEQAVRLRRSGLSYRSIGAQIGVSHTQARRLVESAFAESAQRIRNDTDALLGEELDRVDGLIRTASTVVVAGDSAPIDRLRACATVLKCSEAKVRWLGLGAAGRPARGRRPPSSAELARVETAGPTEEQLDEDLRALGWAPVGKVGGQLLHEPVE